MAAIAFEWADAWLLASIVWAAGDRAAPLSDVVAAGNCLNHAIFTWDEMRLGLGRLVAEGHVVAGPEGLRPTPASRAALRRAAKRARDPVGAACRLLGVDGRSPGNADPGPPVVTLTHRDFARATRAYVRKARETIARIVGPPATSRRAPRTRATPGRGRRR